uniref:Uncharacterized protein n=1 Tax=Octopus bimaculoides TaxID=37653 RepID=A0A0L8FMQ9_OCTBM
MEASTEAYENFSGGKVNRYCCGNMSTRVKWVQMIAHNVSRQVIWKWNPKKIKLLSHMLRYPPQHSQPIYLGVMIKHYYTLGL